MQLRPRQVMLVKVIAKSDLFAGSVAVRFWPLESSAQHCSSAHCAVLYPSETLNYFPDIEAFFSRDYLAELTELHQEHYEWETKLSLCYGSASNPNVAADMDMFCREMVFLEDKIQEVLVEVRRESVSRLKQLDEGLDESTLGLYRLREALQLDN